MLDRPGPTYGSRPEEPVASRIAACCALAIGLADILAPTPEKVSQLLLFALVCAVNMAPNRWGWPARIVRGLVLCLTLPIFFRLTVNPAPGPETESLRHIHQAVAVSTFLAPFSRCRREKDLVGFSLLTFCLFFFSGAFLRSDFFFPNLIAASWALMLAFYANRENSASAPRRLLRQNAKLAAAHLVFTLGLVAVLFLLFPRTLFSDSVSSLKFLIRVRAQASSSYSRPLSELGVDPRHDQLRLTNIHELSRTSGEVLQMRLSDVRSRAAFKPQRPLYLRSALYDTYRNGAWTTEIEPAVLWDSDDGRTDNRTRIALPAFQPERLLIRQQIRTKPLGDLCFCLAQPLRVNLSKVRVFDGDVLLFPYVNHMDREYEVDSELSPPSDHPALATAPEVDRIPRLERYLRVPTSMAKKLGNWGPRPAAGQTPWARAEQIRLHLVNELSYSLAPFMPPEEMDPLEFFLLRKKTGYCTHFASAMALLARMNGLPARVVTGFCYSGPPESDGVFIVRDHHAHAWTEIFFQNHGWIVFDATPPACMPPFTGFEETQGLGLLLSWFMRFNDYLSEFDTSLQADFLKSLLLLPVRAALWIFTTPFLWAMLLGCALIWRFLIPRLPPMKQRRIRRFFSRRRFSTHVEFYDDLLWLLAKTGCRKSPSDTGLEFVQRLAGQWPDRELSWLTHQYYAIRFGGKRLSPEDSVETERCLQVVEQWIAKHNGSLAKSAPLFKQSAPANW